jgi:hypothetical protein
VQKKLSLRINVQPDYLAPALGLNESRSSTSSTSGVEARLIWTFWQTSPSHPHGCFLAGMCEIAVANRGQQPFPIGMIHPHASHHGSSASSGHASMLSDCALIVLFDANVCPLAPSLAGREFGTNDRRRCSADCFLVKFAPRRSRMCL